MYEFHTTVPFVKVGIYNEEWMATSTLKREIWDWFKAYPDMVWTFEYIRPYMEPCPEFVKFSFHNSADAVLFKLTFGGL